jgi:hypothetical protein
MPKHISRLLYQSHFSFMPISSFPCWLFFVFFLYLRSSSALRLSSPSVNIKDGKKIEERKKEKKNLQERHRKR